jgi:hemerythrin
MLQVRCSAHSENCTAHREFIRRLDGWLELLTFGSTPISVLRDIQQQSTAWIEDHIVRIDCRLRGCPLK